MPFESNNYTYCENSNRYRDVSTGRYCVPVASNSWSFSDKSFTGSDSDSVTLPCRTSVPNVEKAEIEWLKAELARRDKLMPESDTELLRRGKIIEERDAAIKAMGKLILEKDARLRRRDRTIEEGDAAIKAKEKLIQEKDARLQRRDRTIEERDAAIKAKEELILEKDAELQLLAHENGALLESRRELQSTWEEWKQTAEKHWERENEACIERHKWCRVTLRQEIAQLRAQLQKKKSMSAEAAQLLVTDLSRKKLNWHSEAARSKNTPSSSDSTTTARSTMNDALSEDHDSEPCDAQGPVESNWITSLWSKFLWSCAVLFGISLLVPDGSTGCATTVKRGASKSSMRMASLFCIVVIVIVGCLTCA